MQLQRIFANTLRVSDMARSIAFYNELMGLELLCGGRDSFFSSLRTRTIKDVILNLEQGEPHPDWGRSSSMYRTWMRSTCTYAPKGSSRRNHEMPSGENGSST
jgi:hypothetical protein